MPELPEVETTRRGIAPHITAKKITAVKIRNTQLRWPIPPRLQRVLPGLQIEHVGRRGKYLLLGTSKGTLIVHLGMSGSLRLCQPSDTLRKHDHFILRFGSELELRLHDPRRFGAVLWQTGEPLEHPLLSTLGPEPLDDSFNADYLHLHCKNRKTSIKQHIMNSHVVVGVGNIYACESLYLAGIHPKRPAGRISRARLEKTVDAIKSVLSDAIAQGGTTLRDFLDADGNPGYFKQQLHVYGRTGQSCDRCGNEVKMITLGQRSTFYCGRCQR